MYDDEVEERRRRCKQTNCKLDEQATNVLLAIVFLVVREKICKDIFDFEHSSGAWKLGCKPFFFCDEDEDDDDDELSGSG